MKERRPAVCAYCRAPAKKLEAEHVFPDSWYPTSTDRKAERDKVPACRKCNGDYGRVEERLLRGWGMCIDALHPAAQGILLRVRRSMNAAAGRNKDDARIRDGTRRKLERSLRIVPAAAATILPGPGVSLMWTSLPSGILALGGPAVPIQYGDIRALLEKLVKGMHFLGTGTPLPEDVEIGTCQVSAEYIALEAAKLKLRPQGIPPGFTFWWGRLDSDPRVMHWHVLIWGHIALHAQTRPVETVRARRP
jgi:hypothetical protein